MVESCLSEKIFSTPGTPPTPVEFPLVECKARARIPTEKGELYLYLYQSLGQDDNKEHLAMVYGGRIRSRSLEAVREGETASQRIVRGASPVFSPLEQMNGSVLTRIHSECFTGETLGSQRCDCGEQLESAKAIINEQGEGVIVYLRQEGRGIGLLDKLKAYNLQDLGHDTVAANNLLNHPADARSYDVAAQILFDLGVHQLRLLTNNPDKIEQLQSNGVAVEERLEMVPSRWGAQTSKELDGYLRTKVERMRHLLSIPEL